MKYEDTLGQVGKKNDPSNILETQNQREGQAVGNNVRVLSYNEWDPLEEVILGVADGAVVPPWHPILAVTMPEDHHEFFKTHGAKPFPSSVVSEATRDLDNLASLLEKQGVIVRRPAVTDHARSYSTPDWSCSSGLYAAMPRDVLLVVGSEIIEAPMAWRCRHFEINSFRPLIKEYFHSGARWTSAPRPMLTDEQYASGLVSEQMDNQYFVTEHEPTFDAADFIRCGRDIFAQRSHVTNLQGIQWLRRHLDSQYSIHEIQTNDPHPMHLANPERLPVIPRQFRDWEIRYAPQPQQGQKQLLYMSSPWISMNVLSLDHHRVLVESEETELIEMLANWGFDPLPCSFRGFNALGGSFHCATVDVRRRGTLQSYF
jgi:glycine amidinotransferase